MARHGFENRGGRRSGLVSWAAIALAVVSAIGCARASGPEPRDGHFFTLDWELVERPSGPFVRGHIRNTALLPARDFHLLIEGLDANGQVTTTTIGNVPSIVLAGDRLLFEVPVPSSQGQYRVSVQSFEWMLPRGGR
jgi:hypothetical protein